MKIVHVKINEDIIQTVYEKTENACVAYQSEKDHLRFDQNIIDIRGDEFHKEAQDNTDDSKSDQRQLA